MGRSRREWTAGRIAIFMLVVAAVFQSRAVTGGAAVPRVAALALTLGALVVLMALDATGRLR